MRRPNWTLWLTDEKCLLKVLDIVKKIIIIVTFWFQNNPICPHQYRTYTYAHTLTGVSILLVIIFHSFIYIITRTLLPNLFTHFVWHYVDHRRKHRRLIFLVPEAENWGVLALHTFISFTDSLHRIIFTYNTSSYQKLRQLYLPPAATYETLDVSNRYDNHRNCGLYICSRFLQRRLTSESVELQINFGIKQTTCQCPLSNSIRSESRLKRSAPTLHHPYTRCKDEREGICRKIWII